MSGAVGISVVHGGEEVNEEKIIVGHKERDITEIVEANKTVRRLPWERRLALIREAFPRIENVNWVGDGFNDVIMMGQMIQDLLKADASDHHTDGPRPRVGMKEGLPRLRQLFGFDYSDMPFDQAFRYLAGDKSVRALEHKIGLSKAQISLLLRGLREPSLVQIEMIAKAFGKEPGWFLDYRLGVIMAFVGNRLEQMPEMSIQYYQKVTGKR